MAFEERVQILSEAEQDELYGPPAFTSADQRFFFSLNDSARAELGRGLSTTASGREQRLPWRYQERQTGIPYDLSLPCAGAESCNHQTIH